MKLPFISMCVAPVYYLLDLETTPCVLIHGSVPQQTNLTFALSMVNIMCKWIDRPQLRNPPCTPTEREMLQRC